MNPNLYNNISVNIYNSTSYINISKNELNYTINDGLYIDYENITFNTPKHVQFFFLINNTYTNNYEGCNLRLTNMSIEELIKNDFKTNYSDPVFLRIRDNNSLSINDKTFYLDNNRYNFNNNFIKIDLILNWDDQSVCVLYNNTLIDSYSSYTELATGFFHIDLSNNFTNPNKFIIYNFYPSTECMFRDLLLCEDFCDRETMGIYRNLTSNTEYLHFNNISILLLLLILFVY